MSELQRRKEMLRQRIHSDRQLIELEVEGLRHRWDSATRTLRLAADLAKPVGAVAAIAATTFGRVGRSAGGKVASKVAGSTAAKAGAGGLVGLAALIPVAITVAKAVASMRDERARKEAAADRAGEDPARPEPEGTAEEAAATDDATAP